MKEEWKYYHGYKVSNYGKVVNKFGNLVKGQAHNFGGHSYWNFYLKINGKRINKPANTLVYELFGEGYRKGMKIFYIDGNVHNNRIDNLYVNPAYTKERTEEQIKCYNEKALLCVKWALKYFGYSKMREYGYDIDNVIGDSLYLIWFYLPSYNSKKVSFTTFCKKYVRFAFLQEWKYHKHYLTEDFDSDIKRWADA